MTVPKQSTTMIIPITASRTISEVVPATASLSASVPADRGVSLVVVAVVAEVVNGGAVRSIEGESAHTS